eukprot:m.26684 g.26684  ORF g.26684 m.26684 type:complete len:508 (-) comp8954_c0_seq2:69-1592(-)
MKEKDLKEQEKRDKEKEKEKEKAARKEKKERKREEEARKPKSGQNSPLLRRLSAFIKKTVASPQNPQSPERSDSRRLDPGRLSPLPELGKGHQFADLHLAQPTWCDLCDDFIWGLNRCSQCKACQYTCHTNCLPQVTLDCNASQRRSANTGELAPERVYSFFPEQRTDTASPEEGSGPQGLLAFLEIADIHRRVDAYNACTPGVPMELLDSAGKHFKGFIRVTMNLSRPIRVSCLDPLRNWSPETSEVPQPSASASATNTRHVRVASVSGKDAVGMMGHSLNDEESSFYLPKNVSKGLFLTSQTSSQEVIAILLRKFRIVTNPRKFALFEVNSTDKTSRRLRRYEEPLVLQLLWGGQNEHLALCLQENQEDEAFPWIDFSTPELQTFLRIVDAEEQENIAQMRARFDRKRAALQAAIEALEAGNEIPAAALLAASPPRLASVPFPSAAAAAAVSSLPAAAAAMGAGGVGSRGGSTHGSAVPSRRGSAAASAESSAAASSADEEGDFD